jgi:hypothetical protein
VPYRNLEFISIVIRRFFATIPENGDREDQLDTNQRVTNQPTHVLKVATSYLKLKITQN